MAQVLFILKRREDFDSKKHVGVTMSTGLYNSAKFMDNMLVDQGITSNLSVVIDNNDIDREVAKYRPTHVIIEALWVVPSKFAILQKLHPKVKWIVRLHSEVPFIANEGMAMDWIGEYVKFDNVVVAANAPRILEELKCLLTIANNWSVKKVEEKVIYLPNYFPLEKYPPAVAITKDSDRIDISCFGAIRPLKNQLEQAIGAIKFAKKINKKLNFHINGGRIENLGSPVNHNIIGLFKHMYDSGHSLINHQWAPRDKFLDICRTIDIGLQVSFSETFNIVAADLVSVGVPVIGSKEIPWLLPPFHADPTDSDEIAKKLLMVYNDHRQWTIDEQWLQLKTYVERSSICWYNYFKN